MKFLAFAFLLAQLAYAKHDIELLDYEHEHSGQCVVCSFDQQSDTLGFDGTLSLADLQYVPYIARIEHVALQAFSRPYNIRAPPRALLI